MGEISVQKFDKICRVCLAQSESATSIYDIVFTHNHYSEVVKTYLQDIFLEYCDILVHQEDNKPQNICESCINRLARAFNVFELFKASDNLLGQILHNEGKGLKEELKPNLDEACSIGSDDDSANNSDAFEDHVYAMNSSQTKETDIQDSNDKKLLYPLVRKFHNTGEESILIKVEADNDSMSGDSQDSDHKKEKTKCKDKTFSCKFCEDTIFKTMDKVFNHVKSDHPLELNCLICEEEFDSILTVRGHIASHDQMKRIVCTKCLLCFKDKKALEEHRSSEEHLNFRWKCNTCDKVFIKSWNLSEHIKEVHLNLGRRQAQCPICNLTFKYGTNIKKHIKINHSGPRMICEQCGNGYSTVHALKRHVVVAHVGGSELQKHREKRKEYRRAYSQKSKEIVGTFACKLCPKTFAFRNLYFNHILTHPESEVDCPFCDKHLDSVLEYRRHKLSEHVDFRCETCGKGMPTRKSLAVHLYNAHAGRSYQCSYCPQSFKNSQSLTTHENIHKKVKPYSCKTCNKRFTQQSQLMSHEIRVHNVKKTANQCHLCQKHFLFNSQLMSHLRTHIGLKPFTCPYCPKTFTETISRHKHVKANHKLSMEEFEEYKKEHQSKEVINANELTLSMLKEQNLLKDSGDDIFEEEGMDDDNGSINTEPSVTQSENEETMLIVDMENEEEVYEDFEALDEFFNGDGKDS